ncbi:MAG: type VII secretion protein EssC [Lachnospiraceae bacterium]|nr:type VII secretion protein EssC [Lachnospiraceae bacterium]
MSARNAESKGLTVFLHLYTSKSCIRKNIVYYQGERRRLFFTAGNLQTALPVMIILEKDREVWKLNGKQVYDGGFCILETESEEEIMAVISIRGEKLLPCSRLKLSEEREVRVGKDYRNEVFYDGFSFVNARHFRICQRAEGAVLEICREEESKAAAGVYVNGRAVFDRYLLSPGDVIELLGLRLIYLKELLVGTAYYGIMRWAQGREELAGMLQGQPEAEAVRQEIRQGAIMEKKLLTEEMEIDLPEKEKVQRSQPLFFQLGPSVTMVIPMILMAVLASAMPGQGGTGYYRISVVMTAATAFLSLFWGIINHIYKKKTSQKEERYRKESYLEYLEKVNRYLEECFCYNRQALLEKYPQGENFLANGQALWNRSSWQKDYLFIRLGIGDIPFQIKIKCSQSSKKPVRDLLTGRAYEIAEKYEYLNSVPVGIDLRKQKVTGFTGELIYPVFLQAILQLAACHSSKDVKLIYFYHEENEDEKKIANCIKWLPHIWRSGGKMRYLAGNEREAGEIIPFLVKELENRQERSGRAAGTYIFLLAARELIKGEGLYRILTETDDDKGIYTLVLEKDKEMLPGECGCQVIREKDREEIFYYEQDALENQKILFEENSLEAAEVYMRRLSGFLFTEPGREELSEKVSFLDLYLCKKVEDLNCQGRWIENQTGERIKVPIGMGPGRRIVYLDIHEKFHGPHGLVAGTTGSGKSELLQTYLLSLAVSFGPEDINFFIIDYKGGGMGNALCRLPHCAGVVSNLSGRQIRRALLSIKSENERRQRLFAEAGVNHITDYTALYQEEKVWEPVPHLLLVVDEFAELKKEEPEFMQEIISVAQVGRSLGVHLILATQKPAGTVDDKIWSNTRFRLCLRVADRQDSMDMLRRPDAANLTGAGQCYLQVGSNELYELFQAGYGGSEYGDREYQNEKVCIVSGTGRRYMRKIQKKEKGITQLEAVIDYIGGVALQLESRAARHLWMPELPDRISLKQVEEKIPEKTGEEIKLCIGICDDPERQRQYPLYYSPLKEGHLCICGAPAAGKSTFLQTLLWQLSCYSPRQIQFMLAGSDNAGVNCFETMPGCLGHMSRKEEAECFFFHVERLFNERKEELSGINFLQYRKHKKDAGAFFFLIIDNYGSFRQMTEDRYELLIEKVAGEGLNYGFYLIITALNTGAGELPGKLFEKMKSTLSLEMSDRFQYGDVLRQYHIGVWPKENVKGRGLCKVEGRVLEFQVPLFSLEDDDYGRITQVTALSKEKTEELSNREKTEKFPCIPHKAEFQPMFSRFYEKEDHLHTIPLGYEIKSGYIAELSLKECFPFLISGGEGTGKKNLLCCLIHGLWKQNRKTILFDRKGILTQEIRKAAGIAGKEKQLLEIHDEEEFITWYYAQKEEKGFCFCISDLADFADMLHGRGEEIRKIREEIKELSEEGKELSFIALIRPGKEMEAAGTGVYELLVKRQYGIHLGGNAANQRMLAFDDLSYAQMNQWEEPGIGYLKKGAVQATKKILVPLYKREETKEGKED